MLHKVICTDVFFIKRYCEVTKGLIHPQITDNTEAELVAVYLTSFKQCERNNKATQAKHFL